MRTKKKLYPIVLAFIASFLSFIIISSMASAVISRNDGIEIRGPVYNNSDIDHIIDSVGNGETVTVNGTQFAALYYDYNTNMSNEFFSIEDVSGTQGNVIGSYGLVYQTTIQNNNYKFEAWDTYPVIFLFGEPYVPLKPSDPSKLTKLIVDSNDTYNVRIGDTLYFGSVYTLEVKQIDVSNKRIWLEFDKDGQYIDDEILSVDNSSDSTWTCKLDNLEGEDNVPVLKVHVNEVFRNASDSFAKIDGLWLADYANVMIVDSDEFDRLNNVSINGTTLSIRNEDSLTLTRGSDVEIGQGMYFKVADTPDNELRFYIYKRIIDPGIYEVRGQVASGDDSWDASNFAGFFYDINDNFSTESLSVSGLNRNVISSRGLKYETKIKNVDYKYSDRAAGWDTYPVICFFGEPYVPLKYTNPSKLTKLLVDSNATYNLSTGNFLVCDSGYTLEVKQIDIDGKRIWLELNKDGQYIDDEIISVDNNSNKTWTYTPDNIKGEDNVPHLKVHFSEVFQREGNNLARIDGRWFLADDFLEITTGDRFGKLSTFIKGATISMSNDDALTLTRGSDQEIASRMYFKVANTPSNELRYYPFVKRSIIDYSKVPIANFSANPTIGCAPLFVQFTDLSQNAKNVSWDFGDKTNSTEKNPTHIYSTAGTYTASLIATNQYGAFIKTATIVVTQQSSSSGGSSGGISHSSSSGGGGGSPEPAKNVQVKELSQAFVTNGKPVKFDFLKNATCVVYVSFDAKKTAGKTTTIAEQLKGKSTLVSELNAGEVYKYFNVWVGTGGFATSKNIENPVVCFRVEKSWLQDKKIDQASIILSRYSDKKWSQLPVKLLNEDNKYLYFTAETPEFSFFAITGKAVEKEKVTETKPATDTSKLEQNGTTVSKTEPEPKPEQETGKGKATSTPGFGIVCGIVCIITVFLHKRK